MTRDLLFFISAIVILLIVVKFYATIKLQNYFDQLFLLETDVCFGLKVTEYFMKYNEMLNFRNRYYPFLSYYLKEEKFKVYADFTKSQYARYTKKLTSSQTLAFYLKCITNKI